MFSCDKCKKQFKRNIDLVRHQKRKTPCYINLKCHRCGKTFDKKYNLESHLNRKKSCKDIRELLDLQIKLAETKLKTEEIVLKQTENKLKIEQEKNTNKIIEYNTTNNIINNITSNIQIASGNINNVFNININNIENLDQHQFTYEEAVKYYSDDIITLISNIFKHQYNSDDIDLKNNKCIKLEETAKGLKKYIVKTNNCNILATFKDIREHILNNYKYMIDTTVGNFIQTNNRIVKKENILPKYKIKGYEKSLDFTYNIRNNGMINKTLKKVIPKN